MWITGGIAAVVLLLFIQEIKRELEEERWWRDRGKS